MIPVCKQVFLRTFDLKEWSVLNLIKGDNEFGIPKKTTNPKPNNCLNKIKMNHIESFLKNLPKMPSHYCRPNTEKQYLDRGLYFYKTSIRDF